MTLLPFLCELPEESGGGGDGKPGGGLPPHPPTPRLPVGEAVLNYFRV